jgi:hypothetical protein
MTKNEIFTLKVAYMDEDFRQWIINRATNMPIKEMCEDTYFMCRVLSDVSHGRSHKFNKSSKQTGDAINTIEILYREYTYEVQTTSG